MKKFFLPFLIVFCCLIHQPCNANERVRLASGEWPPYQSEHLQYAGVVSRIVAEAFAVEGITIEFGYFPWKRSLLLAESCKWNGTFVWFDTPERRNNFYISDPVVDIQYVFFHKKKFAFDWKTIDDLKDIRIGATIGYDYGKRFEEAEVNRDTRVIRKPSDKDNFIRLKNDLIQLFPCDIEVGYEILRQEYGAAAIELFTHHPLPVKSAPHHLLLSKRDSRNKELIRKFNNGLKSLKDSGRYDQYFSESRKGLYNK